MLSVWTHSQHTYRNFLSLPLILWKWNILESPVSCVWHLRNFKGKFSSLTPVYSSFSSGITWHQLGCFCFWPAAKLELGLNILLAVTPDELPAFTAVCMSFICNVLRLKVCWFCKQSRVSMVQVCKKSFGDFCVDSLKEAWMWLNCVYLK